MNVSRGHLTHIFSLNLVPLSTVLYPPCLSLCVSVFQVCNSFSECYPLPLPANRLWLEDPSALFCLSEMSPLRHDSETKPALSYILFKTKKSAVKFLRCTHPPVFNPCLLSMLILALRVRGGQTVRESAKECISLYNFLECQHKYMEVWMKV